MPNQGFWTGSLEGTADRLNASLLQRDTFANRPAAGQAGRVFVATDTGEVYRDNGTTWDQLDYPNWLISLQRRDTHMINWNSVDKLTIDTAGAPTQTFLGTAVTLSVDGNVDEYVDIRTSLASFFGPGNSKDFDVTFLCDTVVGALGVVGCTLYFGLTTGAGAGVLPGNTNDHMGFRRNNTNLQALSADGTTEEATTISTITGLSTKMSTFRIKKIGSTVTFYVNGVLLGTHSTNYPNSGNMEIYLILDSAGTGAATAVTVTFGLIVAQEGIQ